MRDYEHNQEYDKPPYFSTLRDGIAHNMHKLLRATVHKHTAAKPFVLDVACGNGKQTNVFMKYPVVYTGLDSSRAMLNEIEKRYPGHHTTWGYINLIQGTQEQFLCDCIRFGGKYNYVSCCSALYHFSDPLGYVIHAMRIIEKGGYFILETDNPNGLIDSFWTKRAPEEKLKSLDYDMDSLNFNYNVRDIRRTLVYHGFSVKVRGINVLTGLVPWWLTTRLDCPKWARILHNFLARFDSLFQFFPSVGSNFIIIARRNF